MFAVIQRSNGAGRKARKLPFGAAGQDNRNARAENNAGGDRAGQVIELLGDHVSRFERRRDKNIGMPGDRRRNAFRRGRGW